MPLFVGLHHIMAFPMFFFFCIYHLLIIQEVHHFSMFSLCEAGSPCKILWSLKASRPLGVYGSVCFLGQRAAPISGPLPGSISVLRVVRCDDRFPECSLHLLLLSQPPWEGEVPNRPPAPPPIQHLSIASAPPNL